MFCYISSRTLFAAIFATVIWVSSSVPVQADVPLNSGFDIQPTVPASSFDVPTQAQIPAAAQPALRNGLPPTLLDSFVHEAQSAAEYIYGDEGDDAPPPYAYFSKASRINAGIFDTRDAGLTTGHGSNLPDAWGSDEFLAPPGEWSQSGARGVSAAQGPVDGVPAMTVFSSGCGGCGCGPGSANLPPSPGPGYQPIFQHGVFVGYMSPDLIALMQTDPVTAWTQFANSSEFVGPEGLRLSLLVETGAATPEQVAALENMALFGL
jgi:hypothetical protein